MSQNAAFQPYPFLADDETERWFKQRWLLRFRILAALTQIACILLAFQWGYLNQSQVLWSMLVVSLTLVFNLYSSLGQWVLPHLGRRYFFAQQLFDLMAITTLLALTGGWQNPFWVVLLLHTTLGALLVEGALAYGFLVALLVGLAMQSQPSNLFWEAAFWWSWYLPRALVIMVNFMIVLQLAGYLRRNHGYATQIKIAQLHRDRLHGIGALTAGLCHELASPLNTISLRLQRCAMRRRDEDVLVALESLEQCQRILGHLLDSKADPAQYQLTVVDWFVLIQDLVQEWHVGHPAIKLVIIKGGSPAGQVQLPKIPFANCLCDLLDNASEAMGGAGLLSVTLETRAESCQVRLTDQGPGWPTTVRAHLGEPFLSTKEAGVGLGLYNAWLLISSLGGALELLDSTSGGAVLCISLARCDSQR